MTIVKTTAEAPSALYLGRQGERLARRVSFDLTAWRERYGPGVPVLCVRRAGESQVYTPPLTAGEDGSVCWYIDGRDNAVPGTGALELRYYAIGALLRSCLRETVTDPGLTAADAAVSDSDITVTPETDAPAGRRFQAKTVDPGAVSVTVTADEGFDALSAVTVLSIPLHYADVSGVTAAPEGVLAGAYFVDAAGRLIAGTLPAGEEMYF